MDYSGKGISSEVLVRAKKGETEAFNQVATKVLKFMKPMYDPSGREDADDIDSLKRIALWEALQKFDPKRLDLEHSSFTGYARQLVKWRVLDSFPERRRKGNIKLIPLVPLKNEDGTEITLQDLMPSIDSVDEETFIAAAKLKKWVATGRTDTMLRVYKYYSKHGIAPHSELAKKLKLEKNTISSAVRKMKQFLAKDK